MQNRLLLFMVLLIHPFLLLAQQPVIRGTVTDKASGASLPGAAVYVNNSTYAYICDASGNFVFQKYPALPFALVVSAIGYETFRLEVTAENAGRHLQIPLRLKITDLEEVKINPPEPDGWARYGQRFIEELIGYSDYAADCKLINKEDVRFRFDPRNGILKAWAEQPLIIRNKATGYKITYWLEDFELDLFKHRLYYKGYAYFSPLSLSGKKSKKTEANRRAAFNGSFYHFVRSLYSGNSLAEGFEIRLLKRITEDKAGLYMPLHTDTLTWDDTPRWQAMIRKILGPDSMSVPLLVNTMAAIGNWRDSTAKPSLRLRGRLQYKDNDTAAAVFAFERLEHDSNSIVVKEYSPGQLPENMPLNQAFRVLTERKKMAENIKVEGLSENFKLRQQTLEILFTKVIPQDSFVCRDAANAVLKFRDCLHITYTREKEEIPYLRKRAGSFQKPAVPGLQTSILSIHNEDGIHLLEDGNFYESYDLLQEQYWSYEKLDKLMPLDYMPEPADQATSMRARFPLWKQ